EVLQPIRQARTKLVKKDELHKAVRQALNKLNHADWTDGAKLLLILLDADEDCPAVLGPQLLAYARECHSSEPMACVLAKVEYETSFIAAAESLGAYLTLPVEETVPTAPEQSRSGKG